MIILPTTFIESRFQINLNKYRPRWQNYGKKEQHKLGSTMEYVIIDICIQCQVRLGENRLLWFAMFILILHQILVPQLSSCCLCNSLVFASFISSLPWTTIDIRSGIPGRNSCRIYSVCFPRSLSSCLRML